MALTEKELHLLRAVTLAIYSTLIEKRKILREDVMFRTRYLEAVYKSSPQLLINRIDTYSIGLTDAQMNLAYVEVLKLFKEMRALVPNN